MKQAYKITKFKPETRTLIDYIDSMISSYKQQGFILSVRQLYYQLVARGMIPNTEESYKRTASVINDGRLAGLLDWDMIEDRGRDIVVRPRWTSAADAILAIEQQFHMDMWDNQSHRVFVVVEKAALAGVLGGVCREWDVPLLAAKGYPSVSIVREMVVDHLLPAIENGQNVILLHFGDHDPSGIDMTRDLEERMELFLGDDSPQFTLERIALNMDQIDRYNPPPNPAKVTDSRFKVYQQEHGDESWELDALTPQVLADLCRDQIENWVDEGRWQDRKDEIKAARDRMKRTVKEYRSEED